MFEQAARYLLSQIHCDQNDQAIVEQFLGDFAEHILLNSTPANGSTIASFQGLTMREIVNILPDMSPADRIEQVLRTCRSFVGSDVSWLNEHDQAALEEYERFCLTDMLLIKNIAAKLGMEEDLLFINALLHSYRRSKVFDERGSAGNRGQ